ncbi:exopolysaccharide production negative regulator [Thalictrum thalictroides]|uniref:Exopolysaccharide production negative regulator n=1 Tax=Thalictrum thalictroides TaxID=46969 RepID=A0A7J6WMV1_THATH|nr:exopolysaccharide production negative regulator [Thalictrum thalictroides]
MDTSQQQQPDDDIPNPNKKPNKPISTPIKRFNSCITLISTSILALFSFFFVFFNTNLSLIPNPISISSQCRIISTSVDLRSSKVCELGLLNYKAKNVFYPSQSSKFRCRYDYYWTSVFKVEYREHSSGQTRRALVEAPKEALPFDCRPSFSVAWLTKERFKVNETYNCRYMPGISQVDIYSDSLFNCNAKDPSIAEMVKRYFILFTGMAYSFYLGEAKSESFMGALVGMFVGIFTALISVSLVRLLQTPKSKQAKNPEAVELRSAVHRCWNVSIDY